MGFVTAVVLAAALGWAAPTPSPEPGLSVPRGAASSFEDVAGRASQAREAGRLEEATALYREGVGLRPDWAEGWWYLGSLAYERDRHAECRGALERLVALEAQIGPAWALLGLCEFALEDYGEAGLHLERARQVGPVADEPLWWVVLYHQALLQLRDGQFETVVPLLRRLASRPNPEPELLDACGLRLLRRAELPGQIPAEDAEMVRAVGRAECASLAGHRGEAEQEFRALLARYPRQRNLNYGYGLLLAQGGSAEAIDAFRREIELHPDHLLAHVELAFNLLRHSQPREAARAAEAAVRLDPESFVPHLALGRALVASGDLTLGLAELESAARLGPGSPDVFFSLGAAYTRAGRPEDAARANARFQELDQARRSADGASP